MDEGTDLFLTLGGRAYRVASMVAGDRGVKVSRHVIRDVKDSELLRAPECGAVTLKKLREWAAEPVMSASMVPQQPGWRASDWDSM